MPNAIKGTFERQRGGCAVDTQDTQDNAAKGTNRGLGPNEEAFTQAFSLKLVSLLHP